MNYFECNHVMDEQISSSSNCKPEKCQLQLKLNQEKQLGFLSSMHLTASSDRKAGQGQVVPVQPHCWLGFTVINPTRRHRIQLLLPSSRVSEVLTEQESHKNLFLSPKSADVTWRAHRAQICWVGNAIFTHSLFKVEPGFCWLAQGHWNPLQLLWEYSPGGPVLTSITESRHSPRSSSYPATKLVQLMPRYTTYYNFPRDKVLRKPSTCIFESQLKHEPSVSSFGYSSPHPHPTNSTTKLGWQ